MVSAGRACEGGPSAPDHAPTQKSPKQKKRKEKKPLLNIQGADCRWCGKRVEEGRLHPQGSECEKARTLAYNRARFHNRTPPRTQAEADEREKFQGNPRKSPHRKEPYKRRCKPGLRRTGDTGRESHGEVGEYVLAPVAGHILQLMKRPSKRAKTPLGGLSRKSV